MSRFILSPDRESDADYFVLIYITLGSWSAADVVFEIGFVKKVSFCQFKKTRNIWPSLIMTICDSNHWCMTHIICVTTLTELSIFITTRKSLYIYIRLHVCLSVCDSGHLVPGTNYRIEGLTIGKSGSNNSKEWD